MLRSLAGLLCLFAGTAPGQQYPFVLVPNSPKGIQRIVQDPIGRLWVSTNDDVFCFDGERFFSLRDFGFPRDITLGLAVDADGAILSGSVSGLYRFSDGRLERVFSGPRIREIAAVRPGLILFSATEPSPSNKTIGVVTHFYRLRRKAAGWQVEKILPDWDTDGFLTRDPAGNILAVCSRGWCELTPKLIDEWKPGDPRQPVYHPLELTDLFRVVRDRLGCMWFRTSESALFQCPEDATPQKLSSAIAGRNVWAMVTETRDGSMLFPNGGSVAVGRPGAFQIATPDEGLPPAAVTSGLLAQDGTLWIGSLDGLYRLSHPFRLEQWRSRNSLVWTFARDGDRLLAGTGRGVTYLDSQRKWRIIESTDGLGSISSLLPDASGNVYASIFHQGVLLLSRDGRILARTAPEDGQGAESLAKSQDGSVWLASTGVSQLYRQGSSLLLKSDSTVAGGLPAQMALNSRTGEPWACSPNGLYEHHSGTWELVSPGGSLPNRACMTMAGDTLGDLWLGYPQVMTLALAHPSGEGKATIRRYDGIVKDHPYFVAADSRGWMWEGSNDGISVATPGQARNAIWSKLNATDGLLGVDCNHRSFFNDNDGSVWWASDVNIVHLKPSEDLVTPSGFMPAFLSGFSLDRSAVKLADVHEDIPHGKHLTAHLGSLQYRTRSSLQIRYRCLPGQTEWRAAQTMDIDLGTLSWGAHIFEFQSRLTTGEWSQTVSRSITVLRPWWLSWKAILTGCVVCFAIAAAALSWRRRRLASSLKGLPDLADWRSTAFSPELQMIGVILDQRYEIEDLIAVGGFASVLKGKDLAHRGRACAIKIFRREMVDRHWTTHRVQQEVSALEKIRHPSVVAIYGHGVTPKDSPYLVMEFIEGITLRDILATGPMPAAKAGSVLLQAGAALTEIHALGIYHRDLKPENLMLRRNSAPGQELVLIDFSIAIVKEPDKTFQGISRAAGTICYMAPEQVIGYACPASDIHSLAKILIEMLCGQRLSTLLPDAAMDLPERVDELIRQLGLPLSEESIKLVTLALEFDPERRPQNAKSFTEPIGRDLLLHERK